MKVARKSTGPCRLQLTIRAEAGETQETYAEVQKVFSKQARVPAFRPGKAPREVIMRHYEAAIASEARDRLIGHCYREALRKEDVDPVAVLSVDDVVFDPKTGIRFSIQLDVPPDFKLPKYKRITLKDETRVIGEEQVRERVDQLRNMMARFEPDPGHALEPGDAARVTYSGELEGKPLADAVPDAGGLATATDAWVLVDASSQVPGLGTALEGMKQGDTRKLALAFPQPFDPAELAGKKPDYTVTVNEVRRRILPEPDAAFVEKLGFEDESAMRKALRADLETEAKRSEQGRRREAVAQALLEKSRFDLPQSVVEEEVRMTLQSMIQDILRRGGDRDALKANRDALVQTAQTASEDRVRLTYILLRIAREESIEVTGREIDEQIALLASHQNTSAAKLREQLEKRNAIERLVSDFRSRKTMDWLLSQALTE